MLWILLHRTKRFVVSVVLLLQLEVTFKMVTWSEVQLAQPYLFPVRHPLVGVHQDDKHESQPLGEECRRVRPWSLEHCGLLQLHQRLSVPRAPGQLWEPAARSLVKLSAAALSQCLSPSPSSYRACYSQYSCQTGFERHLSSSESSLNSAHLKEGCAGKSRNSHVSAAAWRSKFTKGMKITNMIVTFTVE